jgi:hypothetical protein
VADGDPENAEWQRRLRNAYYFAGTNAELRGDLAAARALLDSSCVVAGALAARDPANVEWARTATRCGARVARIDVAVGRAREALPQLLAARAAARALDAAHPADAVVHELLASVETETAIARLATGDAAAALDGARRAEIALDAVPAVRGAALRLPLVRARIRLVEARAASSAAARRAALEGALAVVGDGDWPAELAVRAQALVALGRRDEAAPLLARLARAGYAGVDALPLTIALSAP